LFKFWDWWSSELINLLPLSLREATKAREKLDIFISPDSVRVEHISRGHGQWLEENLALCKLDDTCWQQIAEFAESKNPRLFVHEEDVFKTVLTLPRKAGEFAHDTVRLQLQLHSPLSLGAINWAVHMIASTRDEVSVMLIVARSSALDAIDILFADRGLMPPVIGYMLGKEPVILRKPLDLENGFFGKLTARIYLVSALRLLSIPLVTIMGADLQASANRNRMSQLQSELEPKLSGHRNSQRAEIARRRAAPIAGFTSAIMILEELARVIPKNHWITKLNSGANGQIDLMLDAPESAEPDIMLMQSTSVRNANVSEKQPSQLGRVIFTIELSLK
jgi:hypothetical protein